MTSMSPNVVSFDLVRKKDGMCVEACINKGHLNFHTVARVGFGQSSSTLLEAIGYVEICVISSSPGIHLQFVINITTTESVSSEFCF